MVEKIQKIEPTTTVSPSSTASRMGVVTVGTPNISGITQPIADSLNAFGEAQAKLYDANWMNDYEFNTGMFMNNKVNEILTSGKNPNLEEFTAEMNSYHNAVLSNAPERLKIAADGWFQQKFITSFDVLREQSNTVTYNENREKFDVWLNNVVIDAENHYFNIGRTSKNREEALRLIHEYSGTVLTQALGSLKGKYEALEPFSGGDMNGSDLRTKELQILQSVEIARINAIASLFYQDVDIQNPIEMNEANLAFANWQSDYLLDKNNNRGINYNVFESETGVKVGEETLLSVIEANNRYVAKIQNNNLVKKIDEVGVDKTQNYQDIKKIEGNLKSLTTISSDFVKMSGTPGSNYYEPMTFDEVATSLEQQGLEVTPEKVNKIFNLNNAKYNVTKLYGEVIFDTAGDGINFQEPKNSLSNRISELDADQITLMGGEKVIMDGYYSTIFKGYGYENTIDFFDSLNEDDLTTISKIMQYEKYIPTGYANWLNQIGPTQIVQMEEKNIEAILDKTLSTFDVLTNGGYLDIEGMSTEMDEFFTAMSQLRSEGMPTGSIAAIMKKKVNRSQNELDEIETKNNEWLSENVLIGDGENSVKARFVRSMVNQWKAGYDKDGDEAINLYASGHFILAVKTQDEYTAQKAAEEFYDRNPALINDLILNKALPYFNYLSEYGDDDEQKNIRFERAINYTLNSMEKGHYGVSPFQDNIPGDTYVYMPIVKEHKNISTSGNQQEDIELALAAYTYNNLSKILSDETHGLYESMKDQFTLPDGRLEIPSMEKIRNLIQNGNIYVLYREDGGTGANANYDVVVANSGTGYLEPENYDTLNTLSYDGRAFNPTEYTNGGEISLSKLESRIDADMAKEDLGSTGSISTTYLDSLEERFIAPLVRNILETYGGLDVETQYAKILNHLYENDDYNNHNIFHQEYKNKQFNTPKQRNELFGIVNGQMDDILNKETTVYNKEVVSSIFNYVEETYKNYEPITKAFISRILIDFPNIDKEELYGAILGENNATYVKNLYNNPDLNPYINLYFMSDIFNQAFESFEKDGE